MHIVIYIVSYELAKQKTPKPPDLVFGYGTPDRPPIPSLSLSLTTLFSRKN